METNIPFWIPTLKECEFLEAYDIVRDHRQKKEIRRDPEWAQSTKDKMLIIFRIQKAPDPIREVFSKRSLTWKNRRKLALMRWREQTSHQRPAAVAR